MVGITCVCIDTAFEFLWVLFFFFFLFITHLYCLVACLSMNVCTHAVLDVLHACVLYFCVFNCSAQSSMFHMERRSLWNYTHYYYYYYYY